MKRTWDYTRLWRLVLPLSLWLLALDGQIHRALAREIEVPIEFLPFVLIGMGAIWGIKAAVNAASESQARRKAVAEYEARVAAHRQAEEAKRVELNLTIWKPERAAEVLAPPADAAETPEQPPQGAAPDRVNVTVFAPPEAQPADDICLQVLLHSVRDGAAAEQQAVEVDAEAQKLASVPLVVPLKHGDKIKITIDPGAAEIAERTQTLEWTGAIAHSLFFMRLPDAAKLGQLPSEGVPLQPKAFIFVNGVPAGFIRFKILIKSKTAPQIPLPLNETARRYRRAFLSYASEDRVHVLRSAQFLAAMNIDFFQDLLSLEPGQRWEQHLYEQIDDCDLFLLFWSHYAAESEWVVKEAEYAIQRAAQTDDRPEMHPVILEGPPPVPPPPSLGHVHFNDPVRYVIFAEEILAAQRAGAQSEPA